MHSCQYNFPKMRGRGGVKGCLELFRKFIYFGRGRRPLECRCPIAQPSTRKVFILVIFNRHKGTATKAPPLKHRHKGHRLQRSLRQFLDKYHLLVYSEFIGIISRTCLDSLVLFHTVLINSKVFVQLVLVLCIFFQKSQIHKYWLVTR